VLLGGGGGGGHLRVAMPAFGAGGGGGQLRRRSRLLQRLQEVVRLQEEITTCMQ